MEFVSNGACEHCSSLLLQFSCFWQMSHFIHFLLNIYNLTQVHQPLRGITKNDKQLASETEKQNKQDVSMSSCGVTI